MLIQLIIGSTLTILIFIGQHKIILSDKEYVIKQRNREQEIIRPMLIDLRAILNFYINIDDKCNDSGPIFNITKQYWDEKKMHKLCKIHEDISDYVKHSSYHMDVENLSQLDKILKYVGAMVQSEENMDEFIEHVRNTKKIVNALFLSIPKMQKL